MQEIKDTWLLHHAVISITESLSVLYDVHHSSESVTILEHVNSKQTSSHLHHL